MSTTTLVSVEEYLTTSYPDGDREYVDGEIVELAMPDMTHGTLIIKLGGYLERNYPQWAVGTAVRVRVAPTRFRLPDLIVVAGPEREGRFASVPPLLAVEIMSPDDRAEVLEDKICEYLAFGIPTIWVINPRRRRAQVYTAHGSELITEGSLRTEGGEITVAFGELFR